MTIQNPLGPDPYDLITLAPADPAAGANFSLSVNANARWQIISVQFQVAFDATAANRRVNVHGFDSTDIIHRQSALNFGTASITVEYDCNIATGSAYQEGSVLNESIPLPDQLYLNIGHSIRITISNIQTTDQISDVRLRVKQWITEN